MGCASSAPFMGEGGALGEIKEAASDMVESGEHALHEMGEAAGKTIHNAVEDVKEVVSNAAHGVQNAAESLGLSVGKAEDKVENAVADAAEGASKFIPLKSMSEEAPEEASAATTPAPSEAEDPPPTTTEMFKPTPAPSFDKPPTPSATVLSMSDMLDKPMDKIDEALASASFEELANDLMNEQEQTEEKPDDTEYDDLPPTKWEALADVMVELPPRMSIDLGTGQLYAVVEEEPPSRSRSYAKPAVLKETSAETS